MGEIRSSETFLSDGWINSIDTDLRRRLSERLSVGAEYGIRKADLEDGVRTIWFHDVGAWRLRDRPHTKLQVSAALPPDDSRLDRIGAPICAAT